jgi:hypothetical protein
MYQLPSGPQWHHQTIEIHGFPTKTPIVLFYRDALECVQWIYGNPAFDGHLEHAPFQEFLDPKMQQELHGNIMTSKWAWAVQVRVIYMPTAVDLSGYFRRNSQTGQPSLQLYSLRIKLSSRLAQATAKHTPFISQLPTLIHQYAINPPIMPLFLLRSFPLSTSIAQRTCKPPSAND